MSEQLGPIRANELQLTRLPRLSGKRYLSYGMALMCFKYAVDYTFTSIVFHHPWSPAEYFISKAIADPALLISSGTAALYGSMLLIALPFAFIGSLLTLRRLKAIGLPPWLVVLFYVPYVNVLFFVILSVVESKPRNELLEEYEAEPAVPLSNKPNPNKTGTAVSPNIWKQDVTVVPSEIVSQSKGLYKRGPTEEKVLALMDKLPQRGYKAVLAAAILPVPIAVLSAMFSVTMMGSYGESVFLAIPFVASVAAPILYGWRTRRSFLGSIGVSITCLMIMASVLLLIPFEGIICLAMASPIAVGIGIVGGAVGFVIQDNLPRNENIPKLMGCFAFVIPLLIIGECIVPQEPPLYENISTIEIAAPPPIVWKYLINFPPIGEAKDFVFKTGVAYPIRAKITGKGAGAIRRCIFTTGEFVEPIEVWDAPRLLRFGVLAQAPPMHELSLYPKLHPPHLDNYLIARQGQFKLVPEPNGCTRLEGTTWYQNYMGPAPYWRLWSDWIIHKIHMRVLNHVKNLAEHEVKQFETEPKVRGM